MLKCSNVPMFRCSDVPVFKCSNGDSKTLSIFSEDVIISKNISSWILKNYDGIFLKKKVFIGKGKTLLKKLSCEREKVTKWTSCLCPPFMKS